MSKVRLLFAQVIDTSPMGLTVAVRVIGPEGEDTARFDFQTISEKMFLNFGELWADLSEVQGFEAELRKVRGENARILYAKPAGSENEPARSD